MPIPLPLRRSLRMAFLGIAAAALGGCFLFPTPKPVAGPAPYGSAYPGLANKSVTIIVYVPAATINEYPLAREEITSFVKLTMRQHLPSTVIIEPLDVIDWQDQTFNWRNMPESDIGRHFRVDRLLSIQVLDYSTRKVIGFSEMQGHLRAQCRIFEIPPGSPPTTGTAPAEQAYSRLDPSWTSLIDTFWPAKPLDPTQTNEGAVRLRTLDSFADWLVRYFYAS